MRRIELWLLTLLAVLAVQSVGAQTPDPILAVGIDEVAEKKWACISSLPSPFGDADSWQARTRQNVPAGEAERKAFLLNQYGSAATVDQLKAVFPTFK